MKFQTIKIPFQNFIPQFPVNAYLKGEMPYPWLLHVALLAPLFVAAVFTGFDLSWWKDPAASYFKALREADPIITQGFKFLTDYGSIFLYTLYVYILVTAWKKKDTEGLVFVVRLVVFSALITLFCTQALKYSIGMPRPGVEGGIIPFAMDFNHNSLPSGHTTQIVSTAVPLGLWFQKTWVRVGLAILILLVGYSRLWLGRHHPVDIVAGILMGSLAARFIAMPRKTA